MEVRTGDYTLIALTAQNIQYHFENKLLIQGPRSHLLSCHGVGSVRETESSRSVDLELRLLCHTTVPEVENELNARSLACVEVPLREKARYRSFHCSFQNF